VLIILIAAISIEVYADYQFNKLKLQKPYKEQRYTEISRDVMWVFSGETSQEKLNSFSVSHSLVLILKMALSVQSHQNAHSNNLPSGFFVSAQAARALMEGRRLGSGNWHLNNIIVSSWVSQNYTKEEALSYLLGNSYFGYDLYGLDNASLFYFNKGYEDLSISEIVSLMEIARYPSLYRHCDAMEKLKMRSISLLAKLKKYDSLKYSDMVYEYVGSIGCENTVLKEE